MEISMRSGETDNRMKSPSKIKVTKAISTPPTNGAMKFVYGIPIFANRPTPRASVFRNF
jgi:hypothetical protein